MKSGNLRKLTTRAIHSAKGTINDARDSVRSIYLSMKSGDFKELVTRAINSAESMIHGTRYHIASVRQKVDSKKSAAGLTYALDRVMYDILVLMRAIMLKFSENPWYFILLLLILLNVAARLPMTPHEFGFDSFGYHYEANYVAFRHSLPGFSFSIPTLTLDIDHLYPFGRPITLITDLAILHQYTGLDVGEVILLFSILLGILGMLSSYMMAREFLNHRLFIFFTVLSFSLSPILLSLTVWTASTRGVFLATLPLLFWCFFRFENTRREKYLYLAFFFAVLLTLVHRMGLLTLGVFGVFILCKLYTTFRSFLNRANRFIAEYLSMVLPPLMLILLAGSFVFPFISNLEFFQKMKWTYHTGVLSEGFQSPRLILNMIVDYLTSEGILLLFMPIGLILVFDKLRHLDKRENERYLFLALTVIVYAAFLLRGEYMTVFLLPVFSLLIGIGLKGVINAVMYVVSGLYLNRIIVLGFVVGCVIVPIVFSNFMITYWVFGIGGSLLDSEASSKPWMQERTYQAGLFLYDTNGSIASNDRSLSVRLKTIVGLDRLKYLSPACFADGHYNGYRCRDDIKDKSMKYVVENENIPGQYVGAERIYLSLLLKSLHAEKDKIYDNGLVGVWSLE